MNKVTTVIAAFMICGSQMALAGKPAPEPAPEPPAAWDCTAQELTQTQADVVQSSYQGGMDAATIANMMDGVNEQQVQGCIDANI